MTVGYVRFTRSLNRTVWEHGIGVSKNDNLHGDLDIIIDWNGEPVSHYALHTWVAYPDQGCVVIAPIEVKVKETKNEVQR